ncbi:4Fe-4S dicluster domain-containing protein [Solidesulfovibrio magneticus]|uniref:4Fe-4S dicluster domain-containing protein n=1 Tax=Solidesulfovibrio magneticus TaxID=184917 RepID=UPI0009D6F600|nr:4Fe-4S dicluster domain-containing protein [Solidesulfovibrio magneticus]
MEQRIRPPHDGTGVHASVTKGAAMEKKNDQDMKDARLALLVYKMKNIMRLVVAEGETACTNDHVRPTEKCTGCMSCMVVCALSHEGRSSSEFSGIRIGHHTNEWTLREKEQMLDHSICRHCPGIPPCDEVCPKHAHFRSDKLGAVLIDHDACIRCRACVKACPYHACWYSKELDKIVKCDLCHDNDDDPQCIGKCPSLVIKLEKAV